jgi:hypothetical protein
MPKEFTDAEAEAFIRYLTEMEKQKKKTLVDALLETPFGKSLIEEWIRKKGFKGKERY